MVALDKKNGGWLIWLLQGPKLVDEGKLPKDVFVEMTNYVLGLPTDDTKQIIQKQKEHFYSSLGKSDTFFAKQENDKRQHEQDIENAPEQKRMKACLQ